MSNHQVLQTTNLNFITQSIINNIDIGICMLNEKNIMIMVNDPFVEELEIHKPHLIGVSLLEVLPEFEEILKKYSDQESLTAELVRHGNKKVTITLQTFRDTNHEDLTLIHLGRRQISEHNGGAEDHKAGKKWESRT